MRTASGRGRAAIFLSGIALGFCLFAILGAGGKVTSPTGTAPDRYV